MGIPSKSFFLSLDLNGDITERRDSFWCKVFEVRAMRRRQERKFKHRMKKICGGHGWSTRPRRSLMKRTRRMKGMERKVRTLRKLVPNGKSRGLGELFEETADYILFLQMQVKVLQALVKVSTDSNF
ncbi:PREDICTED: transcription factor UPBEAT1-like [Nelumbo nucifera]|uniref:Transcription factor UPBEAT1-like n=2 Tax=Nelumbo nucifera TaxID=4432 RepID=A0A1U8AXP0_NELNU|nr:PREDICTED: transcription factor UPBEAT1-like [Nelumbo nucifera]DAD33088.1 TPA_asm: hypothetical protein HUJ06_011939 [Nelumbo nucifera]